MIPARELPLIRLRNPAVSPPTVLPLRAEHDRHAVFPVRPGLLCRSHPFRCSCLPPGCLRCRYPAGLSRNMCCR